MRYRPLAHYVEKGCSQRTVKRRKRKYREGITYHGRLDRGLALGESPPGYSHLTTLRIVSHYERMTRCQLPQACYHPTALPTSHQLLVILAESQMSTRNLELDLDEHIHIGMWVVGSLKWAVVGGGRLRQRVMGREKSFRKKETLAR